MVEIIVDYHLWLFVADYHLGMFVEMNIESMKEGSDEQM